MCTLIKQFWGDSYRTLNAGRKPSPYIVELISALERSLAYAHTGNAKVLSTSLMHPLWLSRGIIDQGMPSLSPILSPVLQSTNVPVIDSSIWPDGGGGRFPAIASKRAQILTYGEGHYAVRIYISIIIIIVILLLWASQHTASTRYGESSSLRHVIRVYTHRFPPIVLLLLADCPMINVNLFFSCRHMKLNFEFAMFSVE